jgi:chromosome partitioning protein
MGLRVLFTSQKGGVGKSTLARSLAVTLAEAQRSVLLADFDLEQLTCVEWRALRVARDVEPDVEAASFGKLKKLEKVADRYDAVVLDTRGLADGQTVELARWCQAVFLPTSYSRDDLAPTLALADRLVRKGVERDEFVIAFARTGRSERQEMEARGLVEERGYRALVPSLPQKDGFVSLLATGRVGREATNPSLREAAQAMDDAMLRFVERRAAG